MEFPSDPVTGKRNPRAKTFKTKKEAEKALANWISDIDRGTAIDATKMTVAEYMTQWLETYALHNVRPLNAHFI